MSVVTDRKNVSGNFNIKMPITGIIRKATKKYLPEFIPEIKEDFAKQIEKAAEFLRPNIINIPNRKEVEIIGAQHECFKNALTLLNINKQLLLKGPTGAGKSHLCESIAKAMELNFGHISCTAGMSESHLTGRMVADGTYIPTKFVDLYENGGVFLLDEVDAADSNVLLVINSALANGKMPIPNRKENPVAIRNENFYCIVAANTWGNGSYEYSGREILDKAFLDRFALNKVFVDYDESLEKQITNEHAITSILQYVRKNCSIERSISTRTIISAYKMTTAFSLKEIFDVLTLDWTSEEKNKFLESIDCYKNELENKEENKDEDEDEDEDEDNT